MKHTALLLSSLLVAGTTFAKEPAALPMVRENVAKEFPNLFEFRTPEKIPSCMFWVGAVKPELVAESKKSGKPLPSLHSPFFAPVVEPTIKTAITTMCASVLELAPKK